MKSACNKRSKKRTGRLRGKVRKCQLVHLFYYSQENTAETWRFHIPSGAHWAQVNKLIRNGNISCRAAFCSPEVHRFSPTQLETDRPLLTINWSQYSLLLCIFIFYCVQESLVRLPVSKKPTVQQAERPNQSNVKMDHAFEIRERAGKALWRYTALTLALYTDML